ncbi:MAG: hypothetical protein CVU11_06445 [Bacteroidetes bacterium HGW-Bacteroidetes-6]|jgi:hypothetical protein|nr:MAG: hypothetical protein CVU11_06445 [Bacteroidetes bacterium HGW-Bacteroidetes-6]
MNLGPTYRILCVELVLNETGLSVVRLVTMKKAGRLTHFDITGKYNSIEDIPKNAWNKAIPVVILVNGKGVITRTFNSSMLSLAEEDVLNSFFPNTNAVDFVVSANYSGNNTWASVLRYQSLTEFLKSIRDKGVFITGIYCGLHFASIMYPFIPNRPANISTGSAMLGFSNGELISVSAIETSTDKIAVGDESISACFLPLIGCGFDALDQFPALPGKHIPEISESAVNRHWYSKFTTALRWSLGTIFILLVINYLFFSQLRNKANEMQAVVEINQNMLTEYDSLLAEFNRKKDFLSQAGLLNEPNISWYADQIASTTPQLISLTLLNINPVSMSGELEDEIVPEAGLIEIRGKTPDPVMLHTWVDTLARLEWVDKARVMNYSQNSRSGPASFVVTLQTKNDE